MDGHISPLWVALMLNSLPFQTEQTCMWGASHIALITSVVLLNFNAVYSPCFLMVCGSIVPLTVRYSPSAVTIGTKCQLQLNLAFILKFNTTQFAASHNYYSFFTYTHHFYSRKSLGSSSMWHASTSKPQETTAVLICFVVCSLCTSTAQGVSRIHVGWCIHTSNTFFVTLCIEPFQITRSLLVFAYFDKLFTGVHCCATMINWNGPRVAE